MTFDIDNQFLVPTFENIVAALPTELVEESKHNGSYYDFHIKTVDYIIVPKNINFTFKYMHLIQQYSPEYWANVTKGWSRLISPNFGDTFNDQARAQMNATFDNCYNSDYYNIMPPIVKQDEQFIYFKNLEAEATELDTTIKTAFQFSKLYESKAEHRWDDQVTLYIFPVNDVSFYGMVNGKLTMVYPKWNSFLWSVELPKYITNTTEIPKIVKFKQFDISTEQETIRLMNGALSKDLFK